MPNAGATQDTGVSAGPLRALAKMELQSVGQWSWRMVEAQHRIATRKLVDSNADHDLLERLLDRSKPQVPTGPEFDGLHYLLATPFRYPPLRHGSQFGSAHARGIWYGATAVRTALAEVAFYRLLFLSGTRAEVSTSETEHSLFKVEVATESGVDWTLPEFARHREALADSVAYLVPQAVGDAMRERGVEAFLFHSAREPNGGVHVGVLTPRAFATRSPHRGIQTWHCSTSRREIIFERRGVLARQAVVFEASQFEVGGEIIAPRSGA